MLAKLSILKFRRAEDQTCSQPHVHLRHGIVDLRAQDPRSRHFLLQRRAYRVRNLSGEELRFDTVERDSQDWTAASGSPTKIQSESNPRCNQG